MRLGLLGPANDRDDVLERAVRFLYRERAVHRAVYLGLDLAIERVVEHAGGRRWSGTTRVRRRLAARCRTLHRTRSRATSMTSSKPSANDLALRVFGSLARSARRRLVELLNGKVAVMIHDKALLDEDDIASATYLVFGKSPEPMIKADRQSLVPGAGATLHARHHGARGRTPASVELTLYDNGVQRSAARAARGHCGAASRDDG